MTPRVAIGSVLRQYLKIGFTVGTFLNRLAICLFLCSTGAIGADIVFMRGSPERLAAHEGVIPDNWLPRIVIDGPIAPSSEFHLYGYKYFLEKVININCLHNFYSSHI